MTVTDSEHTRQSEGDARLNTLIETAVRSELRRQIESERKVLTDAVSLAIKIVLAAFGVLLAIFTVFGLTTWKDIKAETASLVSKQAADLLQKADTTTGVREQLNDLLNRTVIAATLAQSARKPESRVELARNDWDRLRTWLQKEDLPLQDFQDVLAVLNSQVDDRKKTDANRLLGEMLDASDQSPYRWMRKQPEKIEAILTTFKHRDLGASALLVVESRSTSMQTKLLAIEYLREVLYRDGTDRLLALRDAATDQEVRRTALVAAASLRPEHPSVIGQARRLLEDEQAGTDSTQTALDLLGLLYGASGRGQEQALSQAEELKSLAPSLFSLAASSGLRLRVTFDDEWHIASSIFARTRGDSVNPPKRAEPFIQFWMPISSSSSRSVFRLTMQQFENFSPYWQFLADRSNKGALADVIQVLPRTDFRARVIAFDPIATKSFSIRVSAGSDAKVTLSEGEGSRREHILASLPDLRVPLGILRDSERPSFAWTDTNGGARVGWLDGLTGSGYRFRLSRDDAK